MNSNGKSKRKVWTREETVTLLKCYLARKDEFEHSRKKNFAYEHVLEDMVFQGFADPRITASAIEGKMKTLLGSYKTAKDNRSQTGASPNVVPYMDVMEEIFGDKPIISNIHTVHLGDRPISPLSIENKLEKTNTSIATPPDIFDGLNQTEKETMSTQSSTSSLNQTDTEIMSTSSSKSKNKMRCERKCTKLSAKENYYQAKLKIFEKKAQKKADFLDVIQKSLEEKWREEMRILKESEEKKILFLENKNGH